MPKFSFLLSTPIILAAVIFSLDEFVFDTAFIVGVISSFIVNVYAI